ncbi:hypothetical protein [Streptomyces vastus]|uniref:Uncharacterized protein n=1 Tax=Streptomyces vastus TaxID=285451 RepID=A0ABP6CJU2_9ACTN
MTRNVSIKQVSHGAAGEAVLPAHTDPAAFALALEVARALHPPLARAPEVVPAPATAARPARRASARRRTVRS